MNSEYKNKCNIMIDVEHVTKSFPTPYGHFDALKNVSFKISKGQFLAITEKSGGGQLTLGPGTFQTTQDQSDYFTHP